MDRAQRADAALLRQACLGQVAAGVATELNRPMGAVHSNLDTLRRYVGKLAELVEACDSRLSADPEIEALRDRLKIGYVLEDLPAIVAECMEGTDRVRRMLDDFEAFTHECGDDVQYADLNQGLRSALNLAGPDIRGRACVRLDLGELPPVRCVPAAVNQALLNLLVRAADAIERHGELRVTTRMEGDDALVEIAATGVGPAEAADDAGLAMAREVMERHGGGLAVHDAAGVRTFRARLPARGAAGATRA